MRSWRRPGAFGGPSFGAVGPFVKIVDTAHRQADPNRPRNAIVIDTGSRHG